MSTWKEAGRRSVPKVHWSSRLHRMPRSHTRHPPWPRRVAFLHPLPCTLRCPLRRARARQWATHTSHTHMEQSDGTAVPVTGDVATSPCPSPVPPPPMPLMSPASFANEASMCSRECAEAHPLAADVCWRPSRKWSAPNKHEDTTGPRSVHGLR